MSDPTSLVPANPVSSWTAYFAATLDKPLHPLFEEADQHLGPPGRMADLGCGVGHAVLHYANIGWHVEAYDGHAEALEILQTRVQSEHRVTLHHELLQNVRLEAGAYDALVAAYSLFFLDQREFGGTWRMITEALRPDGIFVGEFLGPNDDWADTMTTHSREQVEDLLSSFKLLYFEEAERDGFVSQGQPKHWHVFHVIARKL